jgi:class 3 adenylate cyclase/pimeloyl-ACP methyl ester carboxylesterase
VAAVSPDRPLVKYCQTRDGTRLAYFEIGDGPPLLYLPSLPQHLLLSWDIPFFRDSHLWLAARSRLIRYDSRGTGMSQTTSTDRSVEAFAADLEDLVDYLDLRSFTIFALAASGLPAIAYAADHPDRVEKMVLWNVYPSFPEMLSDPRVVSLINLASTDWELFTETFSRVFYGWDNAREAAQIAAVLRRSCTQEEMVAAIAAQREASVVDFLPRITAPTLVVHYESIVGIGVNPSSILASGIPNASLRMLPRPTVTPFDDPDASGWLGAFLWGEEQHPAPSPGDQKKSGAIVSLRTVLFTDLVGHTEMMSRLGDERGRAVLREHERITREVLKAHGGTEVKTMGDGFMASFGSVTKAVECAIALQRAFAEREGEALTVRVGLNAGEPIEEDGDLFGATVILASRIAAKAGGGEILVADTVRGLCSGKGFLFADRGEFVAKGFEEPVRVYEVAWSQ